MLKIDLSNEMQFSFPGPNLCLLGTTDDFRMLAEAVLPLTDPSHQVEISIGDLPCCEVVNAGLRINFRNKPNAREFAFLDQSEVNFNIDSRIWDRIFKFFVLMSWRQSTYYLNVDDSSIDDLGLIQEAWVICSSEF